MLYPGQRTLTVALVSDTGKLHSSEHPAAVSRSIPILPLSECGMGRLLTSWWIYEACAYLWTDAIILVAVARIS